MEGKIILVSYVNGYEFDIEILGMDSISIVCLKRFKNKEQARDKAKKCASKFNIKIVGEEEC